MQYQHGGDIYTREIDMDYSANLNPLGLPDGVRKVLESCIHTDVCSVYPDSRCGKLREALGRFHEVPEEWIICGNGAADLVFGLVHACMPRRGLVTAPAFSEYEQAMVTCGCRVDHLFLEEKEGFSLDTEVLLQRITGAAGEGRPYDMVFLCNPNNPTGIPVPAGEIRRAAQVCRGYGTRLIMDECFCDFLDGPEACSVIPFLEEYPNLFVLKAFTKLYSMAGLRLGYGLCSDGHLLERLGEVRQPWSVSGLAQKAGEAALKEQDFVRRTREVVGTEREWMRVELEKLGFTVYDSQANYLFFKIFQGKGDTGPDRGDTGPDRGDTGPDNGDAGQGSPAGRDMEMPAKGWLYHRLLKHKVLIRSCSNYPGLNSSFYRVCVKTREENQRLMEYMTKAVKEETGQSGMA
ncbi:putative histidinol-phosphate transaminase [Clostridiales bacterium 1_7_47FAA]|nr:putative histidinol-phosphate transaminase [Clostridiales bacterium 1_7_47FAA]